MMKRLAASLLLTLALSAPVQAQDTSGVTPAIAQCLQQNAAAVESAEPDLTKAADFLANAICAVPIAEEQHRINIIRTQKMAERNRAQCQDRVAQQKAQDATSANPPRRNYENCELIYNNQISNSQISANDFVLPMLGLAARPPAVASMAAKLILDLRLAHNKSRP